MLFNSFRFLWLFPLIFLVYYAIMYIGNTKKLYPGLGNLALILISYGLYLSYNPTYVLVLLGVTAISYLAGIVLADKGKRAIWPWILLILLPLLLFKYSSFISSQFNSLFEFIGLTFTLPGLNWALPIGISFFTFQAVGYVVDVYKGKIAPERNWWHYMLFVCFFPQIVSGPISRAADLLPQIRANRQFDYNQAVSGLRWLLWGMFMKVVMADRVGIMAGTILDNWQYQSGPACLWGSILYTFQIYGDFAGYSFMALGVGRILGFNLVNNFNHPYLSQSITEFWRRWHISLSTWLRDYVYIPLGGSRCSKLRNYLNILITFLVSGLWHGANWTFIVWGGIHGVAQVIEKILGLNKSTSTSLPLVIVRVLLTFMIVNLAWIFFRMPTFSDSFGIIKQIFTNHDFSIVAIAPSIWLFTLMSMFAVVLYDIAGSRINQWLNAKSHSVPRTASRWAIYSIILCMIVGCGVLDSGQFIYVSF